MITLHGARKKWSPEGVKEFILACRTKGGLPMFRTGFAGVRFREGSVLAYCYAPREPVDSVVFTETPPEQILELERTVGDWRVLWSKFAPGEPLP